MDQMSEALKAVAGDRMKGVLGKLTNNRVAGLVTGAGVTAVIQSSSVTTVMLVGFVILAPEGIVGLVRKTIRRGRRR